MPDALIDGVVQMILQTFRPEKIILFSQKRRVDDTLVGFKLCVVAGGADRHALEGEILKAADCPICFDVVVYTPQQWQRHLDVEDSFARQIMRVGTVLYG